MALHERETERFGQDPAAARALLATDPDQSVRPEHAALTAVASVLLNLDATLSRE